MDATGFARELTRYLTDPTTYINAIPDIEQTLRTSVEDNFRVGGRYGDANPWGGGTQRWDPVAHPDSSKRILVDTADMLNSIDVRIQIEGGGLVIEMSVRPFYARFHQDGTVHMPARPFLVIQDEDVENIIEIMADALAH